ncbi:DUF2474 domain-containing protein [Rhizobium rhizogenes]|uniref:DUF2474 domain-containing protein n=1 Tax=Rhizobium rhizogenes TaxID=359 RepID=UPI0028685BA9|nr:DUF2474 domain-containing protein [Rhizobium rhizogenes]
MVLLCLSRESENRRGISLMADRAARANTSWLRRIGWLVLIWVLSVISLAIAAAFFRLFMNLAGLTL